MKKLLLFVMMLFLVCGCSKNSDELVMVTEVLNMISELAGSGITMIIVSHEMNFIKKCASRVLFLENGTIEFDGTVSEAFDKKENKRLNDFLSSIMH